MTQTESMESSVEVQEHTETYLQRYRKNHPEYCAKNNEYNKKWRVDHSERVAEYMRKYREEHPEYRLKQNELVRKWFTDHPNYRKEWETQHPHRKN